MKRHWIWNCLAVVAPLSLPLQGGARAADTCSCDAHFEVVYDVGSSRVTPFKPDIPVDHFTALKDKGALQTMNSCRREARDQAHSCMDKIWKNRWHPDQEPFECHTTHGIRGLVPFDIKRDVERAACQTGSPIANLHNAVVKVIRRTHGDAGCGPGLEKAKTVVISSYTVDCPSVRNREKLGVVAEGQVDGIDRPGSDLAQGATAGDGSVSACKAACSFASACKAWTWVPAGQGAASKCWLKSAVPWHVTSPGMVSGVRQHTSQ